jgi:hypothetical protein
MGRFEIHGYLKYVGWIATAVMAAASAVMFISAFIGSIAKSISSTIGLL